MKPLPTVERVREVLEAGANGVLTWRIRPSRRVRQGDVAGSANGGGYIQVCIDGRIVAAHRLIWVLLYGEWPGVKVDHINGDRADNRAENLRLATSAQNNHNAARRSDNRSGLKGVSWDASRQQFKASISVDGRTKNIGRYPTAEAAHAAYSNAATQLRGDFARIN